MAHNIEFDTTLSPASRNLVMHDENAGSQATIRFFTGDHQIDGLGGFTLRPARNSDDQRPVKITGEDLYAFRELLNELPEEAFVRPADPKPRWVPGDLVVVEEGVNGRALAYYRDVVYWHTVGSAFVYRDDHIDEILEHPQDAPRRATIVRQANG